MSDEEMTDIANVADDGLEMDAVEEQGDSEGTLEAEAPVHEIPEEFREIARKYKAHESLSDDELDLIADRAISVLRGILTYFDAGDASIDEYDGGEGELILDVSNADLAILIGRHGKTLEAFQYMFSLIVNNSMGFRYPVVVDIEGYKNRRRQKLEVMAQSSANKAMSRGCEVRMHPMKPFERRIVHLTLHKLDGVTTHSEGAEPNRYVVIVPTGNRG